MSTGSLENVPPPKDPPPHEPAPQPTGRQPQAIDANRINEMRESAKKPDGLAPTDRQPQKVDVDKANRGATANSARQPTALAKGQPRQAGTTAQQSAPGTARQPTAAANAPGAQGEATKQPARGHDGATPSGPETLGPDGRTDRQIATELTDRTGKSLTDLTLGLGRGPIKIDVRELEAELTQNGTLKPPGEALYATLKQGIENKSPEALEAAAALADRFYHVDQRPSGERSVAVAETDVNAAAKQAGISPEAMHKIIDLVKPFAPTSNPLVMDSVLKQDPYNADRYIEVARIGPAESIRSEKEAGQQEVSARQIRGFMSALGGLRPGAASAGLVPPRGGAAEGPPRTYDSRTGAYKPETSPYGGLVPPKPGEQSTNRGFQNERHVAEMTGGRLARDPSRISDTGAVKDATVSFTRSNGQKGSSAVDVFGPNGELILVGGPSKEQNMSKTIQRLTDLKLAANANGVGAAAYFTNDTSRQVIQGAQRVLGADHVHVFDRPPYKQP